MARCCGTMLPSLQAGFYAFTSFAILSLLTSHKLQYEVSENEKKFNDSREGSAANKI